jgi:hypothetical protein
MPIKFNCPKCGQELNVKDEMAGKQGKCPKCKSTVTVPTPAAPRPAAAPPVRKKPVPEVEEVEEVEEAEVVEEDEPPRRRSQAVKKGKNDFDFSDDEEEDTRVSSRRSSRRRDDDADDEDEPRRKKKSRRDDDEDEEPRRGKRASARRRRDEDEDDDYDDDDEGGSSEKRKKARERQRRKAWKTATTGVFLNFISMCAYTGGCAVVLLAFLVVLLATLVKSTGFLSFAGILGYLAIGLFMVAWIVYIVGSGFLVVSPSKNGEKGLGITCVSVGAVLLAFTIYIWVAVEVDITGLLPGPMGGGGKGMRTFTIVILFWPLVEWARLSMFALYQWAASKTMKEGELVATSLMLAIVIPSAGFGSFIVVWLLGMVFSSSPSMALVYLMQFVILLMVGGWAALMGWFTLHTSAVKNSMDHA